MKSIHWFFFTLPVYVKLLLSICNLMVLTFVLLETQSSFSNFNPNVFKNGNKFNHGSIPNPSKCFLLVQAWIFMVNKLCKSGLHLSCLVVWYLCVKQIQISNTCSSSPSCFQYFLLDKWLMFHILNIVCCLANYNWYYNCNTKLILFNFSKKKNEVLVMFF